jgi:NTE family protein
VTGSNLLPGTADAATAHAAAARLREAPLFAAAPPGAVDELAASATERTVPAGAWLFREGDAPEALFVVASGRLRVVVATRDDEATVRVVGPGALLGELGVLTDSPRSASVQAVRDSHVLELDGARFSALVDGDAAFAAALARELARQLQGSGGLLPPAATAAVYTVVAATAGAAVDAFVHGLADAFACHGATETLERAEPHDVAAAEERCLHVLLVVRADAPAPWRAFALRQSDRTLVVTDGSPPAETAGLQSSEVAFVGDVPAARIAPWLEALEPPAHHVVPAGDADAVARVARRLTGRSLGIVLSGGGARGFAHIGALDALRTAGFAIDRVGGCSIGSFIGAMAALGWPTERIVEVCEAELVRRAPFSDYTIPRVSLIRARRAAAMLQRVFGETRMEELQRPLFTVSADLLGSSLVVHRRGLVYEAVGASMSIPGLAPPVALGPQLLVDGGVLNNLPVDLMDRGEGPVVAIDVIRRMESRTAGSQAPPLPSIMETLSRATVLGSVERSERNRRLAALTITPDVQSVGLREFGRLALAVAEGRRAAEEALEGGGADTLRRLLASRPHPHAG